MAKYMKKQITETAQAVGIEKFREYYIPRAKGGLMVDESSYGLYKVVHEGRTSERECMKAWRVKFNGDGSYTRVDEGWIINLHNRQRTYKPNSSGYEVFPLKK